MSIKRVKRLSLKRKACSEDQSNYKQVTSNNSLSYCGLTNIGNTCYINAVVQTLRFCPQLIDVLSLINNLADKDSVANVLYELINKMREVEVSNCSTIMKPISLVNTIQNNYPLFESQYQQHDTQELLQCLLSTLKHVPYKQQPITTSFFQQTNDGNYISKMFEGMLEFETKCLNCEESSHQKEDFFNITVPVLSHSTRRCGPISIYNAITEALTVNNLTSDNKYWCDNCQHLTEGRRISLVTYLPQILIIHINRFSTTCQLSSGQIHKIQGNIATPTFLSFKQWTTPHCNDALYELLAVILHTGRSCSSGHYTAIISTRDKLGCVSWVLFDDDNVSIIPNNNVIELLSPLSHNDSTPYILFYKNVIN